MSPPVDRSRRSLAAGLVLGPAWALVGCGGAGPSEEAPLIGAQAQHPLALAWASSSLNVPVFREQSVLATPDGAYLAAYYNAEGLVCLHLLSAAGVSDRRVFVEPRLSEALLADGHCAISLGLSADGMVHALFGAHATEPWHLRVALSTLMGASDGTRYAARPWPRPVSYPQFYWVGDQLQLWFRADPDSEVHRVVIDAGAADLPLVSERLLTPGSAERVYMNQLAVSPGLLALTWLYRLVSNDDLVRNEGIGIAWSRDAGQSWIDAQGQSLSWPVSRGERPLLIDVPSSLQPLNQTSSRFGPDGRLYLTWYAKDSAGRHQIMLTCASPGERPVTEVVSDSRSVFDLLGRGTLVLPLSRPQVAVSGRCVHVVYRQDGQLVIASRRLQSAGGWRTLRIDAGDLQSWEPSMSAAHWSRQQRLVLYVQQAVQGALDTARPWPAQPAALHVFAEPA